MDDIHYIQVKSNKLSTKYDEPIRSHLLTSYITCVMERESERDIPTSVVSVYLQACKSAQKQPVDAWKNFCALYESQLNEEPNIYQTLY